MMRQRRLRKQLAHGLLFLERQQKRGIQDSDLENELSQFDNLLEKKQWKQARPFAKRIAQRMHKQRSWASRMFEFVLTLVAAVFVAAVIRQVGFELYEIPTGSMRPTFKEQDRIIVSKTAFGLNTPFLTRHIALSNQRIQRGNIVIVTGDGLDLPEVDTMYFYLFPGKKRYVKRCAALPGDWVYFYGGDLFCLSNDEKTLHRLKLNPTLQDREFIPFISSFEGRVESVSSSPFSRQRTFILKHMNQPVGKIDIRPDGSIKSSIHQNGHWIPEFSSSKSASQRAPRTLGEFWGIKNFATCRLLLPQQLPLEAKRLHYEDSNAALWLELHHSPTLPHSGRPQQTSFPLVNLCTTWIPLYEEHCEQLTQGLYTARIVIENGKMRRYHHESIAAPSVKISKDIPDGCYEFYNGKARQIGFGGTTTPLEQTHPIYPTTPSEFAFWFNAGIDVIEDSLSPTSPHIPTRFAYFQDGNLSVMGTPVFFKEDPVLDRFENQEITRQINNYSYFAFQDLGSPDKEPLDLEFFKNFGLKIPEGHYLLLGDNPAMSVDSRFFGPVPEANIQGSPSLLFWPFGKRWGAPLQPRLSISLYSFLLLSITLAGIAAFMAYQHRHFMRRLLQLRKKKESHHD